MFSNRIQRNWWFGLVRKRSKRISVNAINHSAARGTAPVIKTIRGAQNFANAYDAITRERASILRPQ